MVEQIVQFLRCMLPVFQQIKENAGIDRSRARSHHQSFKRRETHRGINADTIPDCRQGAAVAEMTNNDSQTRKILSHHLGAPLRAKLVIDPVESITMDTLSFVPLIGDRIERRLQWHLAMKRRVKY